MEITSASIAVQLMLFFGDAWDAPFSLFQGNQGGVNIYSRDTNALFKDLAILGNQSQTVNEQLYVEAPGPWSTATQAGPI